MIETIIRELNTNNLKYLLYFADRKEGNAKEDWTLEAAAKKDSNYDVIIFKVGPATGWDIPRACMLLQIREVSSEILNLQTLGRIRRNPLSNLEKNSITDKYYLYSNYQPGQRSLATYQLKKQFYHLKLYQGKVILAEKEKKDLTKNYLKEVKKFLLQPARKEVMQENSKATKLVIDYLHYSSQTGTTNTHTYYVYSIFRLKLWNDQMLTQYNKYFPKDLMILLKHYAKQLKVSQEIVIYTIMREYLDQLKKIYLNLYQQQVNKEKYQIIANKSLLKYYQTWIDKEEINKLQIGHLTAYGYQLVTSINKKVNFLLKDQEKKSSSALSNKQTNLQYLDSHPEKIFMEKIIEEMEEENYQEKINFFAKMPTLSSPIYFEYLKRKDGEKHKAYIDFALVEKKKEKVLMEEVKSKNDDYDKEKTDDLLFAFKKYQEQNPELSIKLVVCYVKKEGRKAEISFLDKNNKPIEKSVRQTLKFFFN